MLHRSAQKILIVSLVLVIVLTASACSPRAGPNVEISSDSINSETTDTNSQSIEERQQEEKEVKQEESSSPSGAVKSKFEQDDFNKAKEQSEILTIHLISSFLNTTKNLDANVRKTPVKLLFIFVQLSKLY